MRTTPESPLQVATVLVDARIGVTAVCETSA
jgi:hypothetical protein